MSDFACVMVGFGALYLVLEVLHHRSTRKRVATSRDVIVELGCKLHKMHCQRAADLAEAAATYEAMQAEIARLTENLGHATVAEGDWLSKSSRMMCSTMLGERDALRAKVSELTAAIDQLSQWRMADIVEWRATYEAMRTEIETLRCGDLDAYFAGELSPERRAAFEAHLGRCETCQTGLGDMVQIARIAETPLWAPQQCTAAIACPECGAAPGERCASDRPVHLERWDAWKAAGFARSP